MREDPRLMIERGLSAQNDADVCMFYYLSGLQIWLTRHGAFIQQIRFRTLIAGSLLVLVIAVMCYLAGQRLPR